MMEKNSSHHVARKIFWISIKFRAADSDHRLRLRERNLIHFHLVEMQIKLFTRSQSETLAHKLW